MARKLVFYKSYFMDFYEKLDSSTQKKIDYVLDFIKKVENLPARFFKHIEGSDGLFEIRIEFGKSNFRIFCFFDENKLVILINGFQKKTQKTPRQEIRLAEKLKREYFETKKRGV